MCSFGKLFSASFSECFAVFEGGVIVGVKVSGFRVLLSGFC